MRWLKQEYVMDLNPLPPQHMPIAYGPVTAKLKRHKAPSSKAAKVEENCGFTEKPSADEYVSLLDRVTKIDYTGKNSEHYSSNQRCSLCNHVTSSGVILKCINEDCSLSCHLFCLAKHFLKSHPPCQLLPVEASCPKCDVSVLWGDLIREAQGFHQYLSSKEYEKI